MARPCSIWVSRSACKMRRWAENARLMFGHVAVHPRVQLDGIAERVTQGDADRAWQRLLDSGWIPELPAGDESHWPQLREA